MSAAESLFRPHSLKTHTLKTHAIRLWVIWPLLAAGMILVGLFGSTPAVAADGAVQGACSDGAGPTVVVDFTDLGGEIEIGCAEAAGENGRAALTAAGFATTDSQPGFLCAIDSMPDPCPTTFEGSFWSYWHSSADGEWTSYQVGADASEPAPGELEGWRYNDGTVGPGIEPAAVIEAGQAATSPEPEAEESAEGSAEQSQSTAPDPVTSSPSVAAQSNNLLYITAGFAAVVAAIAIWFVVHRRRASQQAEDEDD